MSPTIQGILVGFAILFVVFALIERLRPPDRRQPIFRAGYLTDLAYWLFTPVITGLVTRLCVGVVAVIISLLVWGRIDVAALQNGYGPAARLPLWLQAALILVISDLVSYWMHRAFHRGRLWHFHAVHHSSTPLDWLSSVRLHPLNDAVMRIAGAIPVLALGFQPIAVAGIVPVLTLMAILVHANVDWDWGPLRSLLASPRFHRWHHTDETEARDRNFAGLFPLWDILFGTYYMPKDRIPRSFGTSTPVPEGLVGQLVFPFRRRAKRPPLPAPGASRTP
jgi:sterol desaturase/sphingolipid hydroxylase (fatty acid hydroxylase superfamily)